MGLVINVDKIEKIYVHKAKKANRPRYREGSPAKYCFFGLIKYESEVKPHWTYWGDEYETREDFMNRETCSNNKFFINHEELYEESIWENAFLYIIMSHSDNITLYYNTYEEMMSVLDGIIKKSKSNLMIIKN